MHIQKFSNNFFTCYAFASYRSMSKLGNTNKQTEVWMIYEMGKPYINMYRNIEWKIKLYREGSIVEPPIIVFFEKICKSIFVEHCCIYVVWYSIPVWYWTGIGTFHWWRLVRIKSPIIGSFEKVDLGISWPDKGSIDVIRNALKSWTNPLWISFIHCLIGESPIHGFFEEVSFAIGPSKGRIQVSWQTSPITGDGSRISWSNGVISQPPIFIIFKHECLSIIRGHDGIKPSSSIIAQLFVASIWISPGKHWTKGS